MTVDSTSTVSDDGAPKQSRQRRRDARDNAIKLRDAAARVFASRGLDAPLELIARQAGVSPGTLYNHFGTREALIDAVVPEVAAARLNEIISCADQQPTPWKRLERFISDICTMQAEDQALNDAVSRRYPETSKLAQLCRTTLSNDDHFIHDAIADGSLRADFTTDDLFLLFQANGALVLATRHDQPGAWQRMLTLVLDGLHSAAPQRPSDSRAARPGGS